MNPAIFPALLRSVIASLVLVANAAHGHAISYQAGSAEAISVEFSFPHGAGPVDQPYTIHRAGEENAFQTGRTDALGRMSFLPDRPGDWQVRLTTTDGHGVELTVAVDEAGAIAAVHGPGHGRFTLVLAGIGYLFGLAGAWILLRRRGER
ncbi:MAG: hypothetical protein ACNA7E_04115 [Wenzhouxiangellaceae bacterium]